MRPHRRRRGPAAPVFAPMGASAQVGSLCLLGALTVAACTERFTALHTDERSAAAIAAAAAVTSLIFTTTRRRTPSGRGLGWAAGAYLVAVLAATWMVTDMTTSGW